MHHRWRRLRTPILLAVTLAALATTVSAQFQGGRGFRGGRGGRGGFGYRGIPANPQYDGAFVFCRVMFRNASDGDGAGWDSGGSTEDGRPAALRDRCHST